MDEPLTLAAIIGLVAGIVQVIKKLPLLAKHPDWCPVVSLILGVVLVAVWALARGETIAGTEAVGTVVLQGLIVGLSASGAYEAGSRLLTKTE